MVRIFIVLDLHPVLVVAVARVRDHNDVLDDVRVVQNRWVEHQRLRWWRWRLWQQLWYC